MSDMVTISRTELEMLRERITQLDSELAGLKRASQEARENDHIRYEAIFNNSRDAIGVSKKGIHVMANPAYLALYGYTNEELMGKPILDLIAPEEREKILTYVRLRDEGKVPPSVYETRGLKKDGSTFVMDVHVSRYKLQGESYSNVIIRDITGQKQTHEALARAKDELEMRVRERTIELENKNSELLAEIAERRQVENELKHAVAGAQEEKRKTEAVIGAIGDGLVIVDRNYTVIYENDVIKEMIGNQIGKTCFTSSQGRETICENCPVELSFRDGLIHRVERTLSKDTGTIHLDITSSPLTNSSGDIVAVIEMVRDTTERKKAEEVLRRSNEQLELLVKERTAKLTLLNEQLRKLSAHLQSAREDERARVAREIHDDLGQTLTALNMDVSLLRKKLRGSQKPLIEKAESMTGLIDAMIESVKRISTELRPGLLDHLGLTAAIEWQVEEFEKRTKIPCELVFEPKEIKLDKDCMVAVFRIFQETLTNIARHAKATKVSILFQARTADLLMRVEDNGKGIAENEKYDPNSLGLIGIRERINTWGGSVAIDGIPGQGTTVTVRLPWYR